MVLKLPEMAPGIGIDLVDVARLQHTLESSSGKMKERIFTEAEWAECQSRRKPEIHLAARFAAKEAAMKCLGTGWTEGVGFKEFEVVSDGTIPPVMKISGRAAEIALERGIRGFRISLSHTDSLAIAIAFAEMAD